MKSKTVRKPAAKKPTKSTKPARKADPALQLLKLVVQAMDAKKAESLQVLDVSDQSSITDYLVLGTATSEPHLRALRVELEKVLDSNRAKILGMDAAKGSGWTVVDAFEIMIHLFTAENRDKYRMESLWKDAVDIPVIKLLK
ncbi:ribosome silencing factor [Oleiharenicola lentus]|jgi:ribosome-associated protein|uniref:Ribosomal silencing factor RsfS n=1 Tax=Oleiharenicola lentus TaxID=2508720 RepID=A0A4Q1C4W8_9BACT|nr:ribosome silencing factor [Oleiharenicola lentus]RXK53462.1 ribosome silencing factor [Oleiharenicola lentus]